MISDPKKFNETALQDFKSVGQILRKKREEHSYTIEHVAEITRITLSNLRAIEEGKIDLLPGKVFVKGFVRNYANLLGLDPNWMIETINQIYYKIEHPEGEPETEAGLTPPPTRSASEPMVSLPKLGNLQMNLDKKQLSIIGGVVAVLFLILIISLSGGGDPHQTESEVVQAVATEGSTNSGEENSPAPQKIHPLTLVIKAKSSDWVYLIIDHKKAQQVKLEQNKRYEWGADEQYDLTLGSGQAASIFLNGEEVEIPESKRDQLVELKLNKQTLNQLNR